MDREELPDSALPDSGMASGSDAGEPGEHLGPSDLRPDEHLPSDTRLWAALQQVGGGTWGGCVFDGDAIAEALEAGRRALRQSSK